jgi:hypothetical protein
VFKDVNIEDLQAPRRLLKLALNGGLQFTSIERKDASTFHGSTLKRVPLDRYGDYKPKGVNDR